MSPGLIILVSSLLTAALMWAMWERVGRLEAEHKLFRVEMERNVLEAEREALGRAA